MLIDMAHDVDSRDDALTDDHRLVEQVGIAHLGRDSETEWSDLDYVTERKTKLTMLGHRRMPR